MATNADLSPDEKRFLVSLLEGIELRLNQVSGYMEGVPNGEQIMLDLRAKGLVAPFPAVRRYPCSREDWHHLPQPRREAAGRGATGRGVRTLHPAASTLLGHHLPRGRVLLAGKFC